MQNMQGSACSENGKINVLCGRIIRAGRRKNLCEEPGESKQRCSADKREKRGTLCAAERRQKARMGRPRCQMLRRIQMQKKKKNL